MPLPTLQSECVRDLKSGPAGAMPGDRRTVCSAGRLGQPSRHGRDRGDCGWSGDVGRTFARMAARGRGRRCDHQSLGTSGAGSGAALQGRPGARRDRDRSDGLGQSAARAGRASSARADQRALFHRGRAHGLSGPAAERAREPRDGVLRPRACRDRRDGRAGRGSGVRTWSP